MVIIDASIANKLFFPLEEGHETVKMLFQKHMAGQEEMTVPDLIFYEVANTLATKSNIPQALMLKSLNQLYKSKLKICRLSDKEIKIAAAFAKKYKVSVYDASYAVLAQENKCFLITADKKFAKQVNLPFVKDLAL